MRLAHPLFICLVFISISGLNFLDVSGFGFWKYTIGIIIVVVVMWLLKKSGLTDRQVPIWVGGVIIILEFTIGIIFDSLVANTFS